MSATETVRAEEGVALRSSAGRWTLVAAIAGSGAAFIEVSIVNVALPAMARDMGLGVAGLQWVVDAYLLALGALILLGGSLGDVFPRRRVFALSLGAFAGMSLACALAWTPNVLFGFRLLQGAAGAVLVPNSLALLETTIEHDDRPTAIGTWSGWSAVTTAIGPLFGGWLVDAASWRWVFAVIAPVALGAAWLALGEDAKKNGGDQHIDYLGAALMVVGLGMLTAGLIDGPRVVFGAPVILSLLVAGVLLLITFGVVEHRSKSPLLPPALFHSSAFTGANVATVLMYAALSGVILLLVLQLQGNLGYSALRSGAAL